MTDAELDRFYAEAMLFTATAPMNYVSDLLDALTAERAKVAELDQAWLNAEGEIERLKAEATRWREVAGVMSRYIRDYQVDEAEDCRCCVDDEHHRRAAEALEAARFKQESGQ